MTAGTVDTTGTHVVIIVTLAVALHLLGWLLQLVGLALAAIFRSPLMVTGVALLGGGLGWSRSVRQRRLRGRLAQLGELQAHLRACFVDPRACVVVLPSFGAPEPVSRPGAHISLDGVVSERIVWYVQCMAMDGRPYCPAVDADDLASDNLVATVHTGRLDTLEVVYEGEGRFAVACTTLVAGSYCVGMEFRGSSVAVADGGVRVTFAAGAVDARHCVVQGPALGFIPLVVDTETTLLFEGCDRFGNTVRTGSPPDLTASLGAATATQVLPLGEGTYAIHLTPAEPGVLQLSVRVDGTPVPACQTEVLVLSRTQQARVRALVAAGKCAMKARLLVDVALFDMTASRRTVTRLGDGDGMAGSSPRITVPIARVAPAHGGGNPQRGGEADVDADVKVTVTARQFSIKRYRLMGLVPQRVGSGKLGRTVRLHLADANPEDLCITHASNRYLLRFPSGDRHVFYAVAQHFLHDEGSQGTVDDFEDKRSALYDELCRVHRETVKGTRHGWCNITLDMSRVLEDSLRFVRAMRPAKWRRKWHVTDKTTKRGIPMREYFQRLGVALFDPQAGLFECANPGKQLCHPAPEFRTRHRLDDLRFAGRITAKCLYDMAVYRDVHPTGVHLTQAMCKMLVGLPVQHNDLLTDDPQYYLERVAPVALNSIHASSQFTFSAAEYDPRADCMRMVELVPDGAAIMVTDANKPHFLSLIAHYRLVTRARKPIDAFLEGFFSIVPPDSLTTFDEHEMELLLCGLPGFDVQELRDAAQMPENPSPQQSRILGWFWEAVTGFSLIAQARLLQLVLGCSAVPADGFASLQPPFTLVVNAENGDDGIMAHPIVNRLELPLAASYEDLCQLLLLALSRQEW